EALGRIGDKSAVPVLLDASARKQDRVLQHSLIYALIEIGDALGTAKGLEAGSSSERCVALIALDQMDNGGLKPETVVPLLASEDADLKKAAHWVAGHHPDWGGALAG